MESSLLVDSELQANTFAIAVAEAAIVVVFLEVEFFGALECEGRGPGCNDSVQSEASFIVVAIEPANEIQTRTLLCQTQRL